MFVKAPGDTYSPRNGYLHAYSLMINFNDSLLRKFISEVQRLTKDLTSLPPLSALGLTGILR